MARPPPILRPKSLLLDPLESLTLAIPGLNSSTSLLMLDQVADIFKFNKINLFNIYDPCNFIVVPIKSSKLVQIEQISLKMGDKGSIALFFL